MASDDLELLNEYGAWVAERKRDAADTSPEKFFLERAKEQAIEKLITIDELLNEWADLDENTSEQMLTEALILIGKISKVVQE